jgi:Tol biopolymer transport system component
MSEAPSHNRDDVIERLPGSAAPPLTIWPRIKQHKVLQWSLAYLGAALALAHGQELLAHTYHWPEVVGRVMMGGLIVGFPVAVALAWYHGHKGLTRISAGELTVVSLLVLIAAVLLTALVRVPGEGTTQPGATSLPDTVSAPIARAPSRGEDAPVLSEPVRFQIPWPDKVSPKGVEGFALSPDGRLLAFTGIGPDGIQRIWVRPMDSLDARPLEGTESPATTTIFWSPDSRYLAFGAAQVAGSGGSGKLKKVALSGGGAESICDTNGTILGGSWNHDGVIIFAQQGTGIMRVSANGGAPVPVIKPGAEGDTLFPQFLEDGRHFIYMRRDPEPERSGAYLNSLDSKPGETNSKQLLGRASKIQYVSSRAGKSGYLLFVRDRALLAQPFDPRRMELTGDAAVLAEGLTRSNPNSIFALFSASSSGILAYALVNRPSLNQVTWFDRQGRTQGTAGEPSLDDSVVLAPEGQRAFTFNSGVANFSLHMLDFSRGTTTPFTFASSPAGERTADAVWSPDGSRVIFVSSEGFTSLYEKPASGSTDEVLLVKSDSVKHPRSWSRDGRLLFYDSYDSRTGRSRVWVLPLEGDRKPKPVLQGDFNVGGAELSPDGHFIAYASDESGLSEIYVGAFSQDSVVRGSNTGGKWQVSSAGGTDPRWRGDGKELYYLTRDAKVMAVGITTIPSFQSGPPKELFQGPPLNYPFGVARPSQWGVTSDGKRFLMVAPSANDAAVQPKITVVLNWQAALKR